MKTIEPILNKPPMDHITLTMLDVSQEITKLQALLGTLQQMQLTRTRAMSFGSANANLEPAPAPTIEEPRVTHNPKTARTFNKVQVIRKTDPALIDKLRRLPEPFNSRAVMSAMGWPLLKQGSNLLDTWKRKGWVVSQGKGTYVRGKNYPGGAETRPRLDPGARVSTPFDNPEANLTIEERLQKALKDRDEARAKGKDGLARILQDKIDKLQAEVDG